MKLEDFKFGEKLERKQLAKIAKGGGTSSNGHTTATTGNDADSVNGDLDDGKPEKPVISA
ncbi:hypothetical protein IWQ47_004758 [Aquimarina sp. EL_43]|uniref:hypothetical protein n=1 Tax=Aquimarina TaxID=290174 RepID=UPI00046F7ECA|nr:MULTISPECIES: hypothetical protein [Aquimarina]MBG6133315.1 hypothetical protein [Aquimarina sp. EL_35]MBG6153506.1 hypothetical protein [Aquimarina sp. EL_32]MBG6171662.1 hypothetical protein [Aquimarina sp. EL_43]